MSGNHAITLKNKTTIIGETYLDPIQAKRKFDLDSGSGLWHWQRRARRVDEQVRQGEDDSYWTDIQGRNDSWKKNIHGAEVKAISFFDFCYKLPD